MTIQEIKSYMKSKGITQIELAERSGIPLQTLRKIFSGNTQNPRLDTMQAIEKALGFDRPIETEKAAALSEKEQRLLSGFNKLIPPMQDYVIEMVESLTNKEVAANNKRA